MVLLSARAGEEARIEGAEAGADDYVVKPFSARELLARIDSRLQIARLRSEALAATRESEEALRASDRRKDEFIAMLSHELRNPLAPLRNGLQILRMQRERAVDASRIHDMMERQLGHLVRLVDDLLEMSRINQGTLELRRERVTLASVVTAAVETSEPLIREAGHHLDVAVPQVPIWLDGDPVRLGQIASNLLNNAAQLHGTRRAHLARRRGPPRSRDAVRARHRHRFRPRGGRWVLRALPPRFAESKRPRNRADHRPPPRRDARRYDPGIERGAGAGQPASRSICRSRPRPPPRQSSNRSLAVSPASGS